MGVYAHTRFALDLSRPAVPHVMDWHRRLKTRAGYEQVAIPLT